MCVCVCVCVRRDNMAFSPCDPKDNQGTKSSSGMITLFHEE